jgi:hypothetical protein
MNLPIPPAPPNQGPPSNQGPPVTNQLVAPVVVVPEIVEEPTYNKLTDFSYWLTADIVPRYVFSGFANPELAGKDLIEEIKRIDPIENPGFQFFVTGWHETKREEKTGANSTKTVTEARSGFYQVITNLVTNSVTPVDEVVAKSLGLSKVNSGSCFFMLPPIPYEMREEIDGFLRLVDEKYKSEGIVLLTYDTTIGGSEGWNYLIPKQQNNAGHCDYDPTSVADQQGNAAIVGSIHSHPGMAAYASGTDHSDQKDFDGLHITYGWSSRTGGTTEYYAELQVQGTSWTIEADKVFADFEYDIELPEDIITAVEERVSKKVGGQTGAGSWSGTTASGGGNHKGYAPTGKSTSITAASSKPTKYPTGTEVPSLVKNFVIGRIEVGSNSSNTMTCNCPFCGSGLLPLEYSSKYRCTECTGFLIMPDMTVTQLVAARTASQILTEFDPDINPEKNVFIWNPSEENAFVSIFTVADSLKK